MKLPVRRYVMPMRPGDSPEEIRESERQRKEAQREALKRELAGVEHRLTGWKQIVEKLDLRLAQDLPQWEARHVEEERDGALRQVAYLEARAALIKNEIKRHR